MTKQFYENEPGVCDECGIAHSQFNDCPTKKKSEPQMNATNKETPATDEQIATYKKRLEPYVNGDLKITYPLLPDESKSLIARIDALQAENKRLRGLCVECRTQLSTTLTLAMLLLPFADEKITDETYNQCVAELQKSRELLDSASKETI